MQQVSHHFYTKNNCTVQVLIKINWLTIALLWHIQVPGKVIFSPFGHALENGLNSNHKTIDGWGISIWFFLVSEAFGTVFPVVLFLQLLWAGVMRQNEWLQELGLVQKYKQDYEVYQKHQMSETGKQEWSFTESSGCIVFQAKLHLFGASK